MAQLTAALDRARDLRDDRPRGTDLRAVTRSPVLEYLQSLIEEYQGLDGGEVATYIPELSRADPSWFGICVVTADGYVYEVGDTGVEFTIQSISKPFVFGMALEDQGRDVVLERVGVEPSGNAFNSIVVDDRSRPFNPMVNAGAIVATGLVEARDGLAPMDRITAAFARYAGRELTLDRKVYESERATGDRNRAIAYLMRSFGMLGGEVGEVIDAYFRQCSLLVTCRDLAMMAATLANRGRNPMTGEHALDPRYVENVLSVMSTCGMYDYAGEWVYTVGLPAKSGVAGGVVAVLPGQLGIGVFSPPLDARGNSERGIKVCQRMAADFDLHPLRFQPEVRGVVRRSYRCRETRSNRVRTAAHYELLAAHPDAALEWCEDRILEDCGITSFGPPQELAVQELLQGLTPAELEAVELAVEVRAAEPGEIIFHEGDHADSIFFVLAGLVSIRLPLRGRGRVRRLATLGAGLAFGEMAFLDEGRRSADVVVEEESVLAKLSIEELHRLGEQFPGVLTKVSANLAHNLSGRLRRANEQVRMLAH